jgi:hypothetical protein
LGGRIYGRRRIEPVRHGRHIWPRRLGQCRSRIGKAKGKRKAEYRDKEEKEATRERHICR